MGRRFTIQLAEDLELLLERVEAYARENGIVFQGDALAGTFSGHGIFASYRVEGDVIDFTVHKKPIFIPWSFVESRIREFFS